MTLIQTIPFSLEFDNLSNNTNFERLKTEESDTVAEICNTTTGRSKRAALQAETTIAIKLSAPDESRFPPSSNELIQETLKETETKTTTETKQCRSEEGVVILDKAAQHLCQYRNNGARNFFSRSKKTRPSRSANRIRLKLCKRPWNGTYPPENIYSV